MDIRRVQQLQLPDCFPGTVLLDGADDNIREDDGDKEHVPVASHQEQAESQGKVQEIKEGKNIVKKDLLQGFPLIVGDDIAAAVPHTGFRLRGGKAGFPGIFKSLRILIRKLQSAIHTAPPVFKNPFPCYTPGRRMSRKKGEGGDSGILCSGAKI